MNVSLNWVNLFEIKRSQVHRKCLQDSVLFEPSTLFCMKEFLSVLFLSIVLFGCDTRGSVQQLTTHANASIDTSTHNRYSWLSSYEAKDMLVNRIALPAGYERGKAEKGSLTDWLRHLPLKPPGIAVTLYNGELKYNQSAQYAVVNIDTGKEDLQQCADAVMRLKAEYHFSKKEPAKIHFNFTSGDKAEYSKWVEGYRPVLKGNKVSWQKTSKTDTSYKSFKAYMRQVFMYAGTSSLSQELRSVPVGQMQPGDVFIKGGFPGHAVMVLDMAVHTGNGQKIFLLAQSYMPAQDIHILKNPGAQASPWYPLNFEGPLETPEWTFQSTELKRFN